MNVLEWKWEQLDQNTARVKVIGGWIVKHEKHALAKKGNSESILCSESSVFIADKYNEWRIAGKEKEKIYDEDFPTNPPCKL